MDVELGLIKVVEPAAVQDIGKIPNPSPWADPRRHGPGRRAR
ncbi:hypothetical protein [Nonomuraea turkmeniaca]